MPELPLTTPEVSYDRYTSSVDGHHCRVLISVGHVLADVFHDERIGLSIHVCAYEGGKIEIGSAIKIQFVLEHLMHGIC